jgi:hypothetical protein
VSNLKPMDCRTFLSDHPQASILALIGVIIAALAYAGVQVHRENSVHVQQEAFFTVDDGKTLFVDDVSKIPPFSKDGQDAVRAIVYTNDDGKSQWVGYLQEYTDEDKKTLETNPKSYLTGVPIVPLVKKPGAAKWTSQLKSPQEARAIMSPICAGHEDPSNAVQWLP